MDKEFIIRNFGSDKKFSCLKCRKKRINNMQLCRRCSVNSEWVPYEEFKNIEYIGKGGFSQIYKATWEKNNGISDDGTIRRSETEIVLKVLNNSQNVDTKFLKKKIIHRNLRSGNILVDRLVIRSRNDPNDLAIVSDLGFSQPANIDSIFQENLKNMDLGMIMWQLTSGYRPFHDQEHGPKLILDILDGKRPEITEDTPKCWANLMKRCWHPDPFQRPTIQEICKLSFSLKGFPNLPPPGASVLFTLIINGSYFSERQEAKKKRLDMIEFKKPFVKNPGYEYPNSRYYSRSLNSTTIGI
ncbi:hypothetical protein Glove_346g80 [Diversispora epigaea]|uniref:Protein kinase domain-containing protein n=1 Tax=Diversispora epigaea TaxID=1348612 RepID=A0A397HKB3_9GLOM|nr:hypothetical protein Glove_346g80 [Diversispora epigaea]